MRVVLSVLTLSLLFAAASAAQLKPQLTLAPAKVPLGDYVTMRGVGFTPNKYALSHLRRPDGTEYPVKQLLADDRGEFTHTVDTLLMDVGTYELWAEDEISKSVSNTVRFEVSLEPPASPKTQF